MKKTLGFKFILFIMFLLMIVFWGSTSSLEILKPISVRADMKKLVCKANKLNVREDAGINAALLYSNGKPVFMLFGQEAEVLGEKNSWYKVRFKFENKEVVGFVIGTYVEVVKEKVENKKVEIKETEKNKNAFISLGDSNIEALITTEALRVRSDAGTAFSQVTASGVAVVLRKNDTVIVNGMKQDSSGKMWYAVSGTFGGEIISGFVLSEYMKLNVSKQNQLTAYILAEKGVYLRQKATGGSKEVIDTKGKKILLKKGTEVKIFHEVNLNREKHFKISVVEKGKSYSGYVDSNYLSFIKIQQSKEDDSSKRETEKKEEKKVGKGKKKDKSITKTEEKITREDSEFKPQKGLILADNTELYHEPSENSPILMDHEKKTSYKLMKDHEVKVRKQYTRKNATWYLITYEIMENGIKRSGAGFLKADKVGLIGELVAKTAGSYANKKKISKKEFVKSLKKEGFPDSYIQRLVEVHEKRPNWIFKVRNLLLDWEDAINGENKLGLNLIDNSKNVVWKSLEKGAYNWKNDSFKVFDGNSYVAASEKALRYFMDPRNFLNESDIYQFELLSYQPELHTEEEIEKILAGTPMENKTYHFIDEEGKKREMSYAETFLLAGVYSGVSPFYLASKVKLEVAGGGAFSKSASGDVEGFEGIYNFYNIGASDSPLPLGAVMNGLRFAKNGRRDRPYNDKISFHEYIKIPWTNPYKAILGGAAYIGDDYIRKGQDTIYLEKFNLTEYSTFSHQYMSNIEGPYRTALQMKKAYRNLADIPLSFSIPLLQNMPDQPLEKPEDEKNPNGYLASLTVEGKTLSPSFSPEHTEYSVKVGEKEKEIHILAEAVHKKAFIEGSGKVILKSSKKTKIKLIVRAENGEERSYTITFLK